MILTDAVNGSGEFIGNLCVDAVMLKGLCGAFNPVEKPITANPQSPGTIDKERADIHAAQAVRPVGLMFEDLRFISVIPVESVLCTKQMNPTLSCTNQATRVCDKPVPAESR